LSKLGLLPKSHAILASPHNGHLISVQHIIKVS